MLQCLGVIDSADIATRWRNWLDLDRGIAHAIGLETTEWIELGRFTTPSGRVVDISADLQAAIASTDSVPPDQQMAPPASRGVTTVLDVANETSLAAAARLIAEGHDPLVLNMANGISPGGGFLSGARAQEEYLCRLPRQGDRVDSRTSPPLGAQQPLLRRPRPFPARPRQSDLVGSLTS